MDPELGKSIEYAQKLGEAAVDPGEYITIVPRRVTTEQHRNAGPVDVGYQYVNRLGLGEIRRDVDTQ